MVKDYTYCRSVLFEDLISFEKIVKLVINCLRLGHS